MTQIGPNLEIRLKFRAYQVLAGVVKVVVVRLQPEPEPVEVAREMTFSCNNVIWQLMTLMLE